MAIDGDDKFTYLSDVTVRMTLVGLTRSMPPGKPFSDAQLRLWIAEIRVAIEHATEHAEGLIAMLEEILAAPAPAGAGDLEPPGGPAVRPGDARG